MFSRIKDLISQQVVALPVEYSRWAEWRCNEEWGDSTLDVQELPPVLFPASAIADALDEIIAGKGK